MSCCNACAANERAAAVRVAGGAPQSEDQRNGTYTGPPLDPVQICWVRQYSAAERASGYEARDKMACETRARAEIAAGRGAKRMPRPDELGSRNWYNARETGPGNDPFRSRRSGPRVPMPGPAAKPAAPAPAPASPRPAVPRPGGTPKGGPSPAPARANPFKPANTNRATLMNSRQVRAAAALVPKAVQHQLRQAQLAAAAPPPGYEWAPMPDPNAPPPGYEWAPAWAPPPDPYADPYAYGWAPPPDPYASPLDAMSINDLLDQLVAWIDGGDPEEMDLAAQVIAELSGPTVSGVSVGAGPVTNPTVRAIDDVISSIWGGLRGIVPGGDAIDAVHQTRRELMYGPEGRTDRGRTSPGGPGGRLPAASSPILPARADTEGRIATVGPTNATVSAIAELQRLVRAAARGGSSSAAARDLRTLKAAARVNPEARRRWAAGVAVMRDDLAAIREGARR